MATAEYFQCAAFASPLAFEHLQDFIHILEVMGDLAWCQLALDAMVKGDTRGKGNSYHLHRILPSSQVELEHNILG